jgi:hypothetical protein
MQAWSRFDLNVWMIWSSQYSDPFLVFYLIENSAGDYAVFYDYTSFDCTSGIGTQNKLKVEKAFKDRLGEFSRIFSSQNKLITLSHLSAYVDFMMQLNVFTDPGIDYHGDVLKICKTTSGYEIDIHYPEVADNGEWVHLSVGKFGSVSVRAPLNPAKQ